MFAMCSSTALVSVAIRRWHDSCWHRHVVLLLTQLSVAAGALKECLLRLNDTSCCVVFARDTSSGQVTIDGQGRPVVHYRPCATTSRHLLDVRISPVSFFQLHQIVANKPPHGAASVATLVYKMSCCEHSLTACFSTSRSALTL